MKRTKRFSFIIVTVFAMMLAALPVFAKSKKPYMAELIYRPGEGKKDRDYPGAVPVKIKEYTCYEGYRKQLDLANAKRSKVKWYSSNKKVATVTKKGLVKTRRSGKVTIKAKYKGKTYKCKFNVLYAKKNINASDYLSNGVLKPGVKIEMETPTIESGKCSKYRVGMGNPSQQHNLGYLETNINNGMQRTFWSAVIDDAIQARVSLGDPVSRFYWYDNKVCLGIHRIETYGAIIGCDGHMIYGEKEVPEFSRLEIVSVSDDRVTLSHRAYDTPGATYHEDKVFIIIKQENMLPSGTFFNVVVSYLGNEITIPCIVDKDFSTFQEFKTERGPQEIIRLK